MVKEYLNQEDLRMRLEGCIVQYKSHFFMVVCNNISYPNIGLINLTKYSESRKIEHTIDHRDANLNTGTPPLGYFNCNRQAYWTTRYPNKRQNQAVKPQNISVKPRSAPYNFYFTKEFYNCLMNEYPTERKALLAINAGTVESMAVSRDFALVREDQQLVALHFKARKVGYYNGTNLIIMPTPEASWIKSLLEKQGIMYE